MFENKQCFFYQNSKCILNKRSCLFCSINIKKIDGIDDPKEYLSHVTTIMLSTRTHFISILSLLIAIGALIISIIKLKSGG